MDGEYFVWHDWDEGFDGAEVLEEFERRLCLSLSGISPCLVGFRCALHRIS